MEQKHIPIEQTEMFRRYVEVSNWLWNMVRAWQFFDRDTVGLQLVRAADSVGANLVEGDGRYALADSLRFFFIARGSAREARYWLMRAMDRGLVSVELASKYTDQLTSATQLLNNLIRYRKDRGKWDQVKEDSIKYSVDDDPFSCDLDLTAEAMEAVLTLHRSFPDYLNTRIPEYP